jgi:hypothetical protein
MKISIYIIVFFLTTAFAQEAYKDLNGKWECYHKEREDGSTESLDYRGPGFKLDCNGLIIELNPDYTASESIGGLSFKYELNDSILKLGNREYVIEKLTKNELVLRDYDPKGISLLNYRQKFKRIE